MIRSKTTTENLELNRDVLINLNLRKRVIEKQNVSKVTIFLFILLGMGPSWSLMDAIVMQTPYFQLSQPEFSQISSNILVSSILAIATVLPLYYIYVNKLKYNAKPVQYQMIVYFVLVWQLVMCVIASLFWHATIHVNIPFLGINNNVSIIILFLSYNGCCIGNIQNTAILAWISSITDPCLIGAFFTGTTFGSVLASLLTIIQLPSKYHNANYSPSLYFVLFGFTIILPSLISFIYIDHNYLKSSSKNADNLTHNHRISAMRNKLSLQLFYNRLNNNNNNQSTKVQKTDQQLQKGRMQNQRLQTTSKNIHTRNYNHLSANYTFVQNKKTTNLKLKKSNNYKAKTQRLQSKRSHNHLYQPMSQRHKETITNISNKKYTLNSSYTKSPDRDQDFDRYRDQDAHNHDDEDDDEDVDLQSDERLIKVFPPRPSSNNYNQTTNTKTSRKKGNMSKYNITFGFDDNNSLYSNHSINSYSMSSVSSIETLENLNPLDQLIASYNSKNSTKNSINNTTHVDSSKLSDINEQQSQDMKQKYDHDRNNNCFHRLCNNLWKTMKLPVFWKDIWHFAAINAWIQFCSWIAICLLIPYTAKHGAIKGNVTDITQRFALELGYLATFIGSAIAMFIQDVSINIIKISLVVFSILSMLVFFVAIYDDIARTISLFKNSVFVVIVVCAIRMIDGFISPMIFKKIANEHADTSEAIIRWISAIQQAILFVGLWLMWIFVH